MMNIKKNLHIITDYYFTYLIYIIIISNIKIIIKLLGWQLSNCGFFLENQRQFFHGTK